MVFANHRISSVLSLFVINSCRKTERSLFTPLAFKKSRSALWSFLSKSLTHKTKQSLINPTLRNLCLIRKKPWEDKSKKDSRETRWNGKSYCKKEKFRTLIQYIHSISYYYWENRYAATCQYDYPKISVKLNLGWKEQKLLKFQSNIQ